ncbi:uncharacterized protein [Lolium perenne]|uniref:uncharacterized protein n=1 Tax=Lolium perenne TaxID=4522 RepID=UPI0021F675A2|nr:uncharacterized protein LOC127332059 [Lolium perenne]
MDDTGCEYRQARILFSILFTVAPEVAHDPNLGNRSVFVTGVTRITTVNDLIKLFPLSTDGVAAAVVRDFDTGERAGLVVLANEADCDEAIASPVVKCLKARDVLMAHPGLLADAAEDHAGRSATAARIQSLIPAAYVEEDSLVHLRCLFLIGEYKLKDLDEEPLLAKVSVCAIVTFKELAVLVYEDAVTAEKVARSLAESGQFRIYDSTMFPLRDMAGAAAGDHQLRGIIPSCFTQPEYLGRIVLFKGLNTENWDARDVARYVNNGMGGLEALILHRSQDLVFGVFSNTRNARLQLRETEETWISIFGLPLTCEILDDDELFAPQDEPVVAQHPMAQNEPLVARDEEDEQELVAQNEPLVAPDEEDEQELVAQNEPLVAPDEEGEQELVVQNEPFVAPDEKELAEEDEQELVLQNEPFVAPDEKELAEEYEQQLDIPACRINTQVLRLSTELVKSRINRDIKACAPDEVERIAEGLIELTVFSQPFAVRYSDFPDRAVLLLGIQPDRREDQLGAALRAYAGPHALAFSFEQGAALVLFEKLSSASEFMQNRLRSCWSLDVGNCQRVPGAERSAEIADKVYAELDLLYDTLMRCVNFGL